MSQEIDRQCARAMELNSDSKRCGVCGWPLHDSIDDGCTPGNCSQRPLPAVRWDAAPPFSSNYAAAHLLEDEIERRGLWKGYTQALCLFTGVDEPYCISDERQWLEFSESDMALLFRATPEQKARAFLKAVKQ